MKISFLQNKCDVKSDKEFNELNSAEQDCSFEDICDEELHFYNKMLNDENRVLEISPNRKVKQNLDIAFSKNNKTKRIFRYKPLLNIAASLIIGIMIFGAYQFNNKRAAQEAYNEEVVNILMNLGKLENRSSQIIPMDYYEEIRIQNSDELIYID